ncbi:MAG: GntR family transcriptional regulator [Acidimicrobiales bacterium]
MKTSELVADAIREDILDRSLRDHLPKEDELRARFGVGKASIREALAILEAEGLITVRRGNVGGSDIHLPTSASAAYTLGLVLTADSVTLGEVGDAIRVLEPECAVFCALREDRAEAVVPLLTRLNDGMEEQLDDAISAVALSREFHEALVANCGNGALSLVTGALERLWSAHEHRWVSEVVHAGNHPTMAERRDALSFHRSIADHIERGDPGVREVLATHLSESQPKSAADRGNLRIDIAPLRARINSPSGSMTL